MLLELQVRRLGVIADLGLVFGPGMTALTGETGTGKTLLVEAIELLLGGRADPVLVRPGGEEATVEGRFLLAGEEVVLARVIPRAGRSRAYVNGRLATATELSRLGERLVDLHGQHDHQSLLTARVQRDALDRFGPVDLELLRAARNRLAAIDKDLVALGGDARARAREMDLLRFQISELSSAGLDDPHEDDTLADEEEGLADAEAHRSAGRLAYDVVVGDGGAVDALGRAVGLCGGRRPLAAIEQRLRALAAELTDTGVDLRTTVETIAEDPERLETVRARRRLLRELSHKYGESLSEMMSYEAEARARLAELKSHDHTVATLESERAEAQRALASAAAAVGRARRECAPRLAAAVEGHLRSLAMPAARLEVHVADEDPGDAVSFLLGANPGEAALPLARVASGGELSRTMLAARLVLTDAPPTLIFDEVDAGVGGEAAVAVGRALAALAAEHQVLVVTHLPQVAAFADHQVAVSKEERDGRTTASAGRLSEPERVVELSRMLSGQPASVTARGHAEELLATASRERGR
jgi:DNA repair protein RecN (Recombination protein N)